jgi:hypothetical protein
MEQLDRMMDKIDDKNKNFLKKLLKKKGHIIIQNDYLQQLREEKTNFAHRMAMNKGTDTSINEAKQNELVFLNHC